LAEASSQDLISRLREAIDRLPPGLRDHIIRVETEALRLADLHRIDPRRVLVAVLGHDLARAETGPRLLELAERYEIAPDSVERASPILLHGPVAARMLMRDYGFDEREILGAVAAHTTARPGMSPLEKLVFVADKIDQEKVERKPALAEVRRLAESDLDAAVLRFLDLHLLEAVERKWQLHPNSVAARNELLAGAGEFED
jgi:predicted HD superfamily hydrolase involved in NAD metabolism